MVAFVYRESYYLERAEPQNDPNDPHSAEKWNRWKDRCEETHGTAEVIIGKQRHGPIGKVTLAFDANITRFGNLEKSYNTDEDAF